MPGFFKCGSLINTKIEFKLKLHLDWMDPFDPTIPNCLHNVFFASILDYCDLNMLTCFVSP